MDVRVPKSVTYFYDLTRNHSRVVVSIPFSELRRRVDEEGVSASICADFPDGLDLEVTEYELGYLKETYGLVLGIDPAAVRTAFEAYRARALRGKPPTGMLPADFLESVASEVVEAKAPPPLMPVDLLKGISSRRIAAQHKHRAQRQVFLEKSEMESLKSVMKLKVSLPPSLKVEMSEEGEDFEDVFMQAQQRIMPGGK